MDYKIPDKLTFKRPEVIKITRLDGKVIDFWEKEFGVIRPVVNKMGEKFYTRQDVESILKIKQLMIIEKMEKARVRKIIREGDIISIEDSVDKRVENNKNNSNKLKFIKSGLEEILTILDKNGK